MDGEIATIMLSGENAKLLWEIANEEDVFLSIGFGRPIGRSISEIEFWMDSTGIESYLFLSTAFNDERIINMIEQKKINFKPRYTIFYCSQCIADNF